MKKLLALAWIFALCAGLLIYSFMQRNTPPESADPALEAVATADEPEVTRQATPDTALPTVPAATPDEPRQEILRLSFLNDHPVLQLIYDQLSDEFFRQTGIRVVTVSSESNLAGQPPVLFSVSQGLPQWPCLDLSDTVVCANLACECFTLKEGDRVLGVANEVEPFGLIFNTTLLAQVGYTAADIDSFQDLKNVAGYLTQNQQTLGFGAFAPANEELLGSIPGDVAMLWDLYEANPAVGDLMNGGAVFGLGTLSDMERLSAGGELQLDLLPLYTGAAGEESQGVHCFVNRYWCVREDATQEEIQGALAFLSFLVSPRTDGTLPVDDLALLAPYRQASYARNSVQQRFRNDIALGKKCVVCEPY